MEEIKVGMGLFLRQEGRSYGCCAEVKSPYTVIAVQDDEILIQAYKMEWNNGHYYNSMPSAILPDPEGEIVALHYSNKISGGAWWAYKRSTGRDYPLVAHFGKAEYYPYLD